MTIEEFGASVSEEFRIPFGDLPADVAGAFAWAVECDSLRDAGTPEAEIPTFDEWRLGNSSQR